jgi:3-phenylpropionate/trans-cinnamate dioxygenase ferredoxin reductase subunit
MDAADDGQRRIVIVGGGLAGLRAAEQLRAAGWADDITVISSEPYPPYNRPPLTKAALVDGVDIDKLAYRQRNSTADVRWRLGETAVGADLTERTVTLADGITLQYDGLVIATGVAARRLPLDAPLDWRHTVRTLDDADALRKQLTLGARVVILGGGFIGCEVAVAATSLGCRVTVVEPQQTPLQGPLGSFVGSEVQRRHEEHGVAFRLGRMVTGIEGSSSGPSAVTLDDGSRLECDVVVESVGSIANIGWLGGNGLDLTDGVLCDSGFHPVTASGSRTDVIALGDVARYPVPMYAGRTFRTEHWNAPGDTAAHAARSLVTALGGSPETVDFNPVPSFWSDQYGTRIQSFGFPHLGTDDVRVLEGDVTDQGVVGFHRAGDLVGIVLLGSPNRMLHYRRLLVDAT